jgi:two-component system, LuxR family, response regulator FixJ
MRPIIYVIDDDDLSLWMLQEMLSGLGAEIRSYSTARQFLAEYQPRARECLITDLRMPELSGLDVQQLLMHQGATLPIIFVSGHPEIRSAVTAIQCGALDFLEKPVQGHALVQKVQAALVRSVEMHAARQARAAQEERLSRLTTREREIAELVALGRSSREIAELFAISTRTVENHRGRAMEKLEVNSSIELARCLNQAAGVSQP